MMRSQTNVYRAGWPAVRFTKYLTLPSFAIWPVRQSPARAASAASLMRK